MDSNQTQINAQFVVQALVAIHSQGATNEQIKIANNFLSECQKNEKFAQVLLTIYWQIQTPLEQVSSLLLFINVIKRNWHMKPHMKAEKGCIFSQETKEKLRQAVMNAYQLRGSQHYKHFNELFRYLTKRDYPQKFPQLQHFIVSSLQSMVEVSSQSLQSIFSNQNVHSVLSTCKTVMKEYNIKKISHNQQSFKQYIAKVITPALKLSQLLAVHVNSCIENGQIAFLPKLLQFLRKADKIVLYSLSSMPSKYQYMSQVCLMVREIVERTSRYENMLSELNNGNDQLREQLQKYLIGILQLVQHLQNKFPFLFADYLKPYLMMLLGMLLRRLPQPNFYRKEKLYSVIISANYKPLLTFVYYMTKDEFLGSIYCRKQTEQQNVQLQEQCHNDFRAVFSLEVIPQILATFVTQVMTAQHMLDAEDIKQQLVFQATQIVIADSTTQPCLFQMCINYLRYFIKCFKTETLPVIVNMLKEIPTMQLNSAKQKQILRNKLEIALQLPHIYDQEQLPLTDIYNILDLIYNAQEYDFFARFARKYNDYMPPNTLNACFSILAKIVASPVGQTSPNTIYQSALSLKVVMNSLSMQSLPLDLMAPCIQNITSLVTIKQFVSNPTLLWPLINLLVKFVRSINEHDKRANQHLVILIIQGLSSLANSNKNQELVVGGLSDLFSTILYSVFTPLKNSFVTRSRQFDPNLIQFSKQSLFIFEACYLMVVKNLDNPALENYDTVNKLWLTAMRYYPTLYQQQCLKMQLRDLNQRWKQLFSQHSQDLIKEDFVLFVQITEQYFLTELLPLSQNELMHIFQKGMGRYSEEESRIRKVMALSTLYFSFSLQCHHVPGVLIALLNELVSMVNKISPSINSLRTYIYFVINSYILQKNANQVFATFTQAYSGNFMAWFFPFVKGMRCVSNKFAFKLNAATILKSIRDISIQNFAHLLVMVQEDQIPIDSLLKVITSDLGYSKIDVIMNSFNHIVRTLLKNQLFPEFASNNYRKVKFHIQTAPLILHIAQNDLSLEFKQLIGGVLSYLQWTPLILKEHIGMSAALSVCGLLDWPTKDLN